MGYIFDAKTMTAEEAKRRRKLAQLLASRASAPARDIPSGISAFAAGLGSLIAGKRADTAANTLAAAEQAKLEQSQALDSSLYGAMFDASSPGTVSNLSGSKQEFIDALMPAAMEQSQRTGVDPRIIVAQAAQETGWGKSAPGNNYFGIKSHGKGGGQTFTTHEVIDGKRVKMKDSFRQFDSPADSVKGYGDFILNNPRYRPFMAAQGLDDQLSALQASGYATDPNYSRSVGAIARSIPLTATPDVQPPQPVDTTGAVDVESYLRNPVTAGMAQAKLAEQGVDVEALPNGRIRASAAAAQPDPMQAAVITPTAGPAAGPPPSIPQPRLPMLRAFDEQYEGIGSVPQNMRNMVEGAPQAGAMASGAPRAFEVIPPVSAAPASIDTIPQPVDDAEIDMTMRNVQPPTVQQGTVRDHQVMAEMRAIAMNPKATSDQRQQAFQVWNLARKRAGMLTRSERIAQNIDRLKGRKAEAETKKAEFEADNLGKPTRSEELAREKFEFEQGQAGQTTRLKEFEAFQAMTPEEQTAFLEMKKAGAASTTVNIEGQTKGRTEADKKYAPDFVEWTTGKAADATKQLHQLQGVLETLQSGVDTISGPRIGLLSDKLLAQTEAGREAINTRERIEEVVQRNLRIVLGAQFTEKEGERLIRRAFNPLLEEKDNAQRVAALVEQIRAGIEARNDAARYWGEKGTLTGWTGKLPSVADFDAVLDGIGPDRPGRDEASEPTVDDLLKKYGD